MPPEDAAAGATPVQDAPPPNEDTQGATVVVDDEVLRDVEGTKKLIQNLRAYERGDKVPARVKRQLDEATAKVVEFENAGKSEVERANQRAIDLEKERDALHAQVRQLQLRSAVAERARTAGAVLADDLYRFIDTDAVETDDSGNPTNIDQIIADLKQTKPALFGPARPGDANGGVRTPAVSEGEDMNALIRRATGR